MQIIGFDFSIRQLQTSKWRHGGGDDVGAVSVYNQCVTGFPVEFSS